MTPAEFHQLILRRMDDQDAKLDRIEKHVAQTNGRVMKLELWQARVLGALAVTTAIGLPAALAVLS